MKNTMFTSFIISVMIFLAINVFASGSESKKAAKDSEKSTKEILKFSVNDFVGRDASGSETDSLKTAEAESDETAPYEKYAPSNDSIEN